MENLDFDKILAQAPYFVLVFIRISAFMAFTPFFREANFLMQAKVMFAFFLSLLLFPILPTASWVIPSEMLSFLFLVSQEILIGILMGLVVLILLFALQMAGDLLGFQMAFSMANAVDTTFETNANILGVMLTLVGTMMLLAVGGDHYLLYTLKRSFVLLPPGGFTATKPLLHELSRLIMYAFEIGFKLASPAVIFLLAIDVTLGIIGRATTKMQIFFVGLPLKIAIGLFMFVMILNFVSGMWLEDILKLPGMIARLFELMKV